jgi:hypothetical protein
MCTAWEREIGTLASSLAMGLGEVVKIIIMKIYDSGQFLPADVLVYSIVYSIPASY